MDITGTLPPSPRLAVVGSRATSSPYLHATRQVVAAASRAGWSVISGGALGVDAEAHRASLELQVPTLAVLPLGSDRPYPEANLPLFGALERQPLGGLYWHQPRGTRPTRGMFASRNRIVVELSDRVVVVAAAVRSGSVQTGRLARRAGRPLAVITGTQGVGKLLLEGAACLGAPDSADLMSRTIQWLRGEATSPPCSSWPPALHQLEALVREGGGELHTGSRLAEGRLDLASLLEAELRGLLVEVAPGHFLCARRLRSAGEAG